MIKVEEPRTKTCRVCHKEARHGVEFQSDLTNDGLAVSLCSECLGHLYHRIGTQFEKHVLVTVKRVTPPICIDGPMTITLPPDMRLPELWPTPELYEMAQQCQAVMEGDIQQGGELKWGVLASEIQVTATLSCRDEKVVVTHTIDRAFERVIVLVLATAVEAAIEEWRRTHAW